MKRLVEGEDQNHSTRFPDYLDGYIAGKNP